MNNQKILKSILPNPLDENSNLADVGKKALFLKEGVSFMKVLGGAFFNIIFYIAFAAFLVGYLSFPVPIIATLIGLEVLAVVITLFVKLKKLNTLSKIEIESSGVGYKNVLVTEEYYGLIESICSTVIQLFSYGLIMTLFFDEISTFVIKSVPENFSMKSEYITYILFAFVIIHIGELAIRVIKYFLIKNIKDSKDFNEVNKSYLIIKKKMELVSFLPFASIVIYVLQFFPVPLYIWAILSFIVFIILIVSIMEIRKLEQFSNENVKNSSTELKDFSNERIEGAIWGIMKSAATFKDVFKVSGTASYGVGRNSSPNSLLITNYRLLLLQVMIPGGDLIADSTDYSQQNVFFNRGELKSKGQELLDSKELSEIVSLSSEEVLFSDIKQLTLKQTEVLIEKFSGEKLKYVFMDREYIDLVKPLFEKYLKEKFVQS